MEMTEQYCEVFDVNKVLSSVGGDREFLTELVGLIQAAWPTLLADIREGMSRGDLRTVGMSARLAKAAARNVSAGRVYESALQLEEMAGKGDLPASQGALATLQREVELLKVILATVGDDDNAS